MSITASFLQGGFEITLFNLCVDKLIYDSWHDPVVQQALNHGIWESVRLNV